MLVIQVSGKGSVSSSTGLKCSSTQGASNTCSASYTYGTPVTLTATVGAGNFSLTGWSGCTGNPCTVYMTSGQTVSATFSKGK